MSIVVDLLDPPAYSPPYDDALARALAAQGANVRLMTSHFAYGQVPEPQGYERLEVFYARARGTAGSRRRTLSKLAAHVPDLRRYARSASADVVHVQWLTLPALDLRLLPTRPTVLTIHDPLGRGPVPAPVPDLRKLGAIIVHSDYARSSVCEQYRVDPDSVHVVRHGALAPAPAAGTLPPELPEPGMPVVLCFGLIRPYKGIGTLLRAWSQVRDAELWIVGRPMMDISELQASAPERVRFLPRFVTPEEEGALYARADLCVLPYERSDRFGFSGVLATAIGAGKPTIVTDVGGLAEVAQLGAAAGVPPSDPDALAAAINRLITDAGARAQLADDCAEVARSVYSWQAAAAETLAIYEKIRR